MPASQESKRTTLSAVAVRICCKWVMAWHDSFICCLSGWVFSVCHRHAAAPANSPRRGPSEFATNINRVVHPDSLTIVDDVLQAMLRYSRQTSGHTSGKTG